MKHRHFFKIISHKKDYVKRFCNNKTYLFRFVIREWTNTVLNDDGMIEYSLIK